MTRLGASVVRRGVHLAAVLGALVGPAPATAQAPDPDAPSWWRRSLASFAVTAFADMQRAGTPDAPWTLAALEIDGTIELLRPLNAALALSPEGVAVGFLDLHIGAATIAPRGQIFAERGFHVQAGRFDVPLGSDWQFFAPMDRNLSSAPVPTAWLNDGGLNDLGGRVLLVGHRFNGVAWLVQGAHGGRAAGARLGTTPFSNPFSFRGPAVDRPLELGIAAHLDGRDGALQDRRVAMDLDLRHGRGMLNVEWHHRRVVAPVGALVPGSADGWHATLQLPIPERGRVGTILLGRLDALRSDPIGIEGVPDPVRLQRATAGVRVDVGWHLIMKTELAWRLGSGGRDLAPARALLVDLVLRW